MAHDAKRRALHHLAAGWSYTTAQHIQWRWEMWGGRCWVCGEPACATDHVIPLKAGGAHWPSNLRPICTPCNCNRKKSRARLLERMAEDQMAAAQRWWLVVSRTLGTPAYDPLTGEWAA